MRTAGSASTHRRYPAPPSDIRRQLVIALQKAMIRLERMVWVDGTTIPAPDLIPRKNSGAQLRQTAWEIHLIRDTNGHSTHLTHLYE